MRRHVAGAELAGVDRGVERAHQLEHRAERRGGVQVVLHRVGERLARLGSTRVGDLRSATPSRVTVVEPRQKIGQPPQRLLGLRRGSPR